MQDIDFLGRIKSDFKALNKLEEISDRFEKVYRHKELLKEVHQRKGDMTKVSNVLNSDLLTYHRDDLLPYYPKNERYLFEDIFEIGKEYDLFFDLYEAEYKGRDAYGELKFYRECLDKALKHEWKYVPESEVNEVLLAGLRSSIKQVERYINEQRQKTKAVRTLNLIISIVLLVGFFGLFVFESVMSAIQLFHAWPNVNVLGIFVGALLYGPYRFLSTMTGVGFIWPALLEGMLLKPLILNIIGVSITVCGLVYWFTHDIVSPVGTTAGRNLGYMNFLFVGIFGFWIAMFGYSIVHTIQYLVTIWNSPFGGGIVGVFYGIFRPIFALIGGPFYAPSVFNGFEFPSYAVSVLVWIWAALYILVIVLTKNDVIDFEIDD